MDLRNYRSYNGPDDDTEDELPVLPPDDGYDYDDWYKDKPRDGIAFVSALLFAMILLGSFGLACIVLAK